jgi:hypothetical protein
MKQKIDNEDVLFEMRTGVAKLSASPTRPNLLRGFCESRTNDTARYAVQSGQASARNNATHARRNNEASEEPCAVWRRDSRRRARRSARATKCAAAMSVACLTQSNVRHNDALRRQRVADDDNDFRTFCAMFGLGMRAWRALAFATARTRPRSCTHVLRRLSVRTTHSNSQPIAISVRYRIDQSAARAAITVVAVSVSRPRLSRCDCSCA